MRRCNRDPNASWCADSRKTANARNEKRINADKPEKENLKINCFLFRVALSLCLSHTWHYVKARGWNQQQTKPDKGRGDAPNDAKFGAFKVKEQAGRDQAQQVEQ